MSDSNRAPKLKELGRGAVRALTRNRLLQELCGTPLKLAYCRILYTRAYQYNTSFASP